MIIGAHRNSCNAKAVFLFLLSFTILCKTLGDLKCAPTQHRRLNVYSTRLVLQHLYSSFVWMLLLFKTQLPKSPVCSDWSVLTGLSRNCPPCFSMGHTAEGPRLHTCDIATKHSPLCKQHLICQFRRILLFDTTIYASTTWIILQLSTCRNQQQKLKHLCDNPLACNTSLWSSGPLYFSRRDNQISVVWVQSHTHTHTHTPTSHAEVEAAIREH